MGARRSTVTGIMALAALAGIAVFGASTAFSATVPPGQETNTAKAYFDSVFSELAKKASAINTPTNREKLRNIGWVRLKSN
jgi:hypothetical protein